MRRKIWLIPLVLLLIGLVFMHPTHADISHDPAAPIPIPSDQSLDFALVGSRAGAFAYYSIQYPGDGRVITFELDMAPGDPAALLGTGFNVYGPNAYLIGSGRPSQSRPGQKVLRWADHNPARWLIQVYNYLDGVTVNYHLQLTGLPDPRPTPTREPVMQPSQAATFAIVSTSLLGDRGGNYHYYNLVYPGNGSEVTLHLYYTPDNYLVSQGFGLNVYGPDGGHCAQGGHDIKFRCSLPGSYLVQVYNSLHALNVSYVLSKEQ